MNEEQQKKYDDLIKWINYLPTSYELKQVVIDKVDELVESFEKEKKE